VRFAISIPQQVADGTFDPAALRAYLARAEELDFTGAWAQEQIIGAVPLLGPVETLTYAAACTERLRLGCAVFITSLYSPVHLAKSLSSLDQLSRGRLEVGIGTGGRGRMFSAFGVDPESFVARFTEGLQLMRALWTEPLVSFDGRFWQLNGAAMEPKPFQRPGPPVWFGARPAVRVLPPRDLTPVSVSGSPEACAQGLRDVAEAGAEPEHLGPDRPHHAVLGQRDRRAVGEIGGGHDQVAEAPDPLEQAGDLGLITDVGRNRGHAAGAAELGAGRVKPLG